MTSRFESINNNIFSPSKPVQLLSGDKSFPFTINIPSLLTTEHPEPRPIIAATVNNHIEETENVNNVQPKETSLKPEEQQPQEQQQSELIQQPVPQSKKYSIETSSSSLIKLPPDYSTDIFIEKQIIDYINGKNPEQWETKCETDKISVYQIFYDKDCTIMIKWHTILPYDFNTVYEVNMNRNIIRQWNKDLSDKNKLISSKDEDGYTLEEWYFYLKMPFIMGDRDLVMKRYVMHNYGGKPKCALIAGYSVDNPDYPDKGKPIRGEMLISGNYFEEIAPQKTLMVVISHADMKFSKTLSKMAKGKGWEKSKENLSKIVKACENYSKGKYTN